MIRSLTTATHTRNYAQDDREVSFVDGGNPEPNAKQSEATGAYLILSFENKRRQIKDNTGRITHPLPE